MLQTERNAEIARGLAEATRVCHDIVRANAHSFYLSSLFLRPEKRHALWAVYAFCRTVDDIADRDAPERERLDALDSLERRLLAASRGLSSDPIFAAFADAAERFEIPLKPALDLLRGARIDVTVQRYETYEALEEYCYLVASTVALLVMPILGTTSRAAVAYGTALGRAMQMTNILRDVGEDARMGRIYLPAEDLARFGCTEEALHAGRLDAAFVALMRFQIARVRALYREAEPGIALLAPDARYTIRLALDLYRAILGRIEANGYDVFTRRAYVPASTKMVLALAAALAR
ncbi:MAG TPA: squalene/phytoene synthase family protein [Candidatus Limnocylindria bacterium]|jgi:phytoene synthase|nr:squalene/phytoene synthase family protein [Candidatus Limnocylindria bacterium]